jgi:RNA polymerase subunit RPABC4/transcription elongation factor Spt4
MVKCKACGKEIAKSAKLCPSCGKRNKRPFWQILLIGLVIIIIVISIIANIAGGSEDNETSSPSVAKTNSNDKTTTKNSFIKSRMYIVDSEITKEEYIKAGSEIAIGEYIKAGSEIAIGEYIIEATGGLGYFQVSSDSSGELGSIIFIDILNKGEFGYVIIQDGDYIKLQDCRMYLSSEKSIQPKDLNKIPSSTYKIGKDLPAGEYKLTEKCQPAYWERFKNPRDSVSGIIANDIIENSAYVKVSDGEYFKLTGIEAALVK